MDTAKIFTSGNSQAIRMPKAYRMKGKDVFITRVGDAVILLPKKTKWNSMIQSLDKFSDDFMEERVQPELENREGLF